MTKKKTVSRKRTTRKPSSKKQATLYSAPVSGYQRPRVYLNLQDTSKAVSISTRRNMVKYSRELFSQVGNIGGAIQQKNMWSFCGGWYPQYKGTNKEWGQMAATWLMERWFPICNVKGHNYDFHTSLYLDGIAKDVDGDSLMVLTVAAGGFPLLEFVPSHRIGQRDTTETIVRSGPYKGLFIFDGVIINDKKRPVAYRVLGDTEDDDRDISARSAQLLYEPEWADQYRGIPRVARVLLDMMDLQDIDHYLKRAVKLDSAMGIMHYTETGMPDASALIESETDSSGNIVTENALHVESLAGGDIMYMKANSGEKLESFGSDRPHGNVDNYLSRIERRALYAVGWPIELLDPSKVGGASVRLITDIARNSIRHRQQSSYKRARMAVAWGLAKAMELGLIETNYKDNWYDWEFSMPREITVDTGNDAAADRDNLKIGSTTLSNIAAKNGNNWLKIRNQGEIETRDLLDRAKRIATDYGISIESALNLLSQRSSNPTVTTDNNSIDIE